MIFKKRTAVVKEDLEFRDRALQISSNSKKRQLPLTRLLGNPKLRRAVINLKLTLETLSLSRGMMREGDLFGPRKVKILQVNPEIWSLVILNYSLMRS